MVNAPVYLVYLPYLKNSRPIINEIEAGPVWKYTEANTHKSSKSDTVIYPRIRSQPLAR